MWKPIEVAPGYEVSDDGRVRNAKSLRENKLQVHQRGYRTLVIASRGKPTKNFLVHRLVAMAFIPNPSGWPHVNHINFIRHDNRVENLEWTYPALNSAHSAKAGRCRTSPKKLTAEQIPLIRAEVGPRTAIAAKYGVNRRMIDRILNGQSWRLVQGGEESVA